MGSFTPTGAHSSCHRNPKTSAAKTSATSKTTPYYPQDNGQNERYNGIVWNAVQCLLHSANRPLSDWKNVLPSTLSSIRTLINTVTKESPHGRFFCFKRGEPLIRPSTLAQGRDTRFPPKFVRAKDQAPFVPLQISEKNLFHLAPVSFGDGRVDRVSTRDLSRRPPDVDNEGTTSQPGNQCRDKETNVDSHIGTQCEPPESVKPVKKSQTSPDSPAPPLRLWARNRKPPSYLGDFVLATN